ncbi:uncharacterized protein METZ01_LOCUS246363, partial [marine metagenome]
VTRHLRAISQDVPGHQCRRAAEDGNRTQLAQSPEVRASDTTVGDVTDDEHLASC